MKRIGGLFLVLLLMAPSQMALAQGGSPNYVLSDQELQQLNSLGTYMDAVYSEEAMATLRSRLEGRQDVAAALSACILFKHRPETYKAAVFENYAVRDYADRGQGTYNMIGRDQLLAAVRDVEARYPSIDDKRLYLLILYFQFRDANQWFMTDNGKLSAARFFRTAFLVGCLEGSEIDPLALVNAIDRATRESMLQ